MKSKFYIVFLSLIVSSCITSRKIVEVNDKPRDDVNIDTLCSGEALYKSMSINKIKASINLDGEIYDTRINIFYIPDSIIFITAANTGFEIVRMAINKDSTLVINRIDKLVYIHKELEIGNGPPVFFKDLEYLLNKSLVCKALENSEMSKAGDVLDFSLKDIKKQITLNSKSLKMSKFEFFHKKTGEYIAGEISGGDTLMVYSNYLLENVEISASGGEVSYNRDINVDLSYNRAKYSVLNN